MKARKSLSQLSFSLALAALLTIPATALPRGLLRDELEGALRRWIVRDRQGVVYLLSPQRNQGRTTGFSLQVSKIPYPRSLDNFHDPLLLNSPLQTDDPLFSAGMTLDHDGKLHLVWSTRSGLSGYAILGLESLENRRTVVWHDPGTGDRGAFTLASDSSRVGDIATAADGSVWFTWTHTRSDHDVSLYLGCVKERELVSQEIASGYGLFPPSLMLEGKGRFYLGWHDVLEKAYYATGILSELEEAGQTRVYPLQGRAFQPILVEAQSRLLVVYEDTYSHLATILPHEATPRPIPLTRSRPRFAWHTFHSPQMTLDRYGIPWLFFVDNARQHVFRTRWLGQDWGPIHSTAKLTWNSPRMEDNHLPIDRLAVETSTDKELPGIGILLAQGPQQTFQSIPVPSLKASPGKKVLFLDLTEIQTLNNLRLSLNQAEKYANNPIIEAGGVDAPDADGAGNFVRVLKEDGVYRMWYSTLRRDRSRPWWEWYQVGYAEGRDGYLFQKKKMLQNTPYVPMVLKDTYEQDPRRRYKLLRFPTHGSRAQAARAGRYDPWQETNTGTLLVSGDGIKWTPEPSIMLFPGGRPFSLMPQSVLYDPDDANPDKRYKAYGFSALNLARRGGGYAYSADAVHWTSHPKNPLLDPFARAIPVVRGGKVEQIHDWVVWKDGDYYLSLYQYQHNGQELDLELAFSRDGENFVFVEPGRKVVPSAPVGNWDCGQIAPSLPLVDENEIKVYYGAICGEDQPKEIRAGGVALLRLDGFTHLQLQEDRSAGSFTTIPVQPAGANYLSINAESGEDGHLQAELLDAATGDPMPGFGRVDVVGFRGDSTSHRVTWRGDRKLSDLDAPFQVRFYLTGSNSFPRIYSFSFQ